MPGLAEILSGRGAYLLDIEVQGRTLRYTTADSPTAIDSGGAQVTYQPGLSDLEILQAPGGRRGGVAVSLPPPPDVSWPQLIARGTRLELSRATVRWWYPGQALARARVLLRGELTRPRWGDAVAPLRAVLEEAEAELSAVPSPSMVCDTQTWPVTSTDFRLDPAVAGLPYPLVVGQPGRYERTNATGTPTGDAFLPATPAYMVEYNQSAAYGVNSRLLVCGEEVAASTCVVFDGSSENAKGGGYTGSATRPIVHMRDGRGRMCATVDFVGAYDDLVYGLGKEYRVAWTGGGGILNRDRTGPLRGAGEVLRYLYERWAPGVVCDYAAQEAQRPVLDAFRLDFVIAPPAGERVYVTDWVQRHLVPILPIEWVEGAQGGYWAARRWRVERTDVRGHIRASGGGGGASTDARHGGEVELDAGGVRNRISVWYGPGGGQDRPAGVVVVDAELSDTDARVRPSLLCRTSQARYGVRELEVVTEVVYEESTAALIAEVLAWRHALPRRVLDLDGAPALDQYEIDDVVAVTASDLWIDDELAVVRGKVATPDGVRLVVELVEDLVAQRRATT